MPLQTKFIIGSRVQTAMEKVKGTDSGHQTNPLTEWMQMVEVKIVGRVRTMQFSERSTQMVMDCFIGVNRGF